MIIVDTNIWIDHLRFSDAELVQVIENGDAAIHPFIVAELGLGSLRRRREVLEQLSLFPAVHVASHHDVMRVIELHHLAGTGVGYVDCHLLTSALLARARLWTRDKRLEAQARRLKIAYAPQAN